jgi:drug/metabolite transporter (DMT)-like permease
MYALATTVCAWFFTFSSKISIEQNHNPALVTFYSMIVALFCGIILLIISWEELWNIWLTALLWLINGSLYLVTTLTRLKSLKYIDTSIYFPIYKALGPLLLISVTVWFFSETLTYKEIIWVMLWISVPLILVSKNWKSKNIIKWLKYLIIWLITAIIASISAKISSIYSLNIYLFTIFALFWWSSCSLIAHKMDKKSKSDYSIMHIKKIWIITGILNFMTFYFFMKAFTLWNNIWIVYTIQSLYIIIPIILSIIIYKEHFDIKKFIAIVLTIATIFFLK